MNTTKHPLSDFEIHALANYSWTKQLRERNSDYINDCKKVIENLLKNIFSKEYPDYNFETNHKAIQQLDFRGFWKLANGNFKFKNGATIKSGLYQINNTRNIGEHGNDLASNANVNLCKQHATLIFQWYFKDYLEINDYNSIYIENENNYKSHFPNNNINLSDLLNKLMNDYEEPKKENARDKESNTNESEEEKKKRIRAEEDAEKERNRRKEAEAKFNKEKSKREEAEAEADRERNKRKAAEANNENFSGEPTKTKLPVAPVNRNILLIIISIIALSILYVLYNHETSSQGSVVENEKPKPPAPPVSIGDLNILLMKLSNVGASGSENQADLIKQNILSNFFDSVQTLYSANAYGEGRFNPKSAEDFLDEIYLTPNLVKIQLFQDSIKFNPKNGKIRTLKYHKITSQDSEAQNSLFNEK